MDPGEILQVTARDVRMSYNLKNMKLIKGLLLPRRVVLREQVVWSAIRIPQLLGAAVQDLHGLLPEVLANEPAA